jgi:hypothetical protein
MASPLISIRGFGNPCASDAIRVLLPAASTTALQTIDFKIR